MKCPGCAQEAPGNAQFCPHCGQRLDQKAPVAGGTPAEAQRATAKGTSPPGDGGIYTEEELWTGRYSPKAMIGTWITTGLISVGLILFAAVTANPVSWYVAIGVIVVMELCAALILLKRMYSIRYRLTTQRFVQDKGIIARQTDRIDIIDINDIRVEQGPIERMLGIGTMIVMANDRTDPDLKMAGIENVDHVADLMDNARRQVQRRRGLRIDVNAPAHDVPDVN